MNWKNVGKVAKLVAYAVVPGAAGYVAYRHIVRPWLDKRAAQGKATQADPQAGKAARAPAAADTEPEMVSSADSRETNKT
jgi:hypothetical protein